MWSSPFFMPTEGKARGHWLIQSHHFELRGAGEQWRQQLGALSLSLPGRARNHFNCADVDKFYEMLTFYPNFPFYASDELS